MSAGGIGLTPVSSASRQQWPRPSHVQGKLPRCHGCFQCKALLQNQALGGMLCLQGTGATLFRGDAAETHAMTHPGMVLQTVSWCTSNRHTFSSIMAFAAPFCMKLICLSSAARGVLQVQQIAKVGLAGILEIGVPVQVLAADLQQGNRCLHLAGPLLNSCVPLQSCLRH